MIERMLVMLRNDFEIPLTVKLFFPQGGFMPSKSDYDKVVITTLSFEYDITFLSNRSLHEFYMRWVLLLLS